MPAMPPFHPAIPVTSLEKARAFCCSLPGCPESRVSDERVDSDFFGHQIVAHLSPAVHYRFSSQAAGSTTEESWIL